MDFKYLKRNFLVDPYSLEQRISDDGGGADAEVGYIIFDADSVRKEVYSGSCDFRKAPDFCVDM